MNIYTDTVDFSHIQDLVTVNALMLLALLIPPWQIMDDMFNFPLLNLTAPQITRGLLFSFADEELRYIVGLCPNYIGRYGRAGNWNEI